MTPVELLADHQQRPRQMGKLLDADLVGEVGSIITGDALRLYLKLDGDGRISEARFQVFGAQSMLASTSVLCEMLPGLDLNQAVAIGPGDIRQQLGGLPPERLPLMPWGIEALREAVSEVMGLARPVDVERGELLCRCHGVEYERIRELVVEDGLEDQDEIIRVSGAGTGCGTCRADLSALIDRLLGRRREVAKEKLSRGRVAAMHQLQRLLASSLHADDPQLELWDWTEDQELVLRGQVDADSSEELRQRLEAAFRDELDTDFRVRFVAVK